MLKKMKKRWWTPKMLGVLLAKLILSGATDLAALTISAPPTAQPTIIFVSASNSTCTIRQLQLIASLELPLSLSRS